MDAPPASAARGGAARAAETVRVLARHPRPAGGDAESSARAHCAARLRAAGFIVREEPFEYSSFVGQWGTPVGGVAALAMVLAGVTAARGGRPGTAVAVLSLGALVLGLAARWMTRRGVLAFPARRCRATNLVAVRGAESPDVWLMAHLDSKSQPVPILARAVGITLLGATWLAALAFALAQLAGASVGIAWPAVAAIAVIGAVPAIATTVGARSPGALDNASGVATVLAAAETAPAERPLGVCLTSAEELGLAGARAWVRAGSGRRDRLPPGATLINCDGVDDTGTTTCMYSGARPEALVARVHEAARQSGISLRAHRLLPGVLTDGVAAADAGWPAVTLSKGGVRTLGRIHTAHDRAEHLSGLGIDEVSRLIVSLIRRMDAARPAEAEPSQRHG